MLVGLLRLRRGDGGSFYLSHLLWKQVGHCQFLFSSCCCLTEFDLLQGVIWLAIATAAELSQLVSPASLHYCTYGLSLLITILHRVRSCSFFWMWTVIFVSFPVSHCSILTEFGSALNIRLFKRGTSFLVLLMAQVTDFLCRLNTVVFGAIDGCNNNRCHSDVSFFDTLYISPGQVSFSPIPSQIFSTLTVL